VGINPTRRGAELAADITRTDCQLVDHRLDPAASARPPRPGPRTRPDPGGRQRRLPAGARRRSRPGGTGVPGPSPDDLYLLIFTSGSTGGPKAVRMTQGRAARAAARHGLHARRRPLLGHAPVPRQRPVGRGVSGLRQRGHAGPAAPVLGIGLPPDVRQTGPPSSTPWVGPSPTSWPPHRPSTTGPPAPLRPRTRDVGRRTRKRSPAGSAFPSSRGTDRARTPSSSRRSPTPVPGHWAGAKTATTWPWSTRHRRERPPATFDEHRRLTNAEESIGELVGRRSLGNFEGYYNNPEAEAERTRNGWYWSGDLGLPRRGRDLLLRRSHGDWLRVDSENFAAAPVERILGRFPGASGVAVYPVPDSPHRRPGDGSPGDRPRGQVRPGSPSPPFWPPSRTWAPSGPPGT
jgi:fatty-acyl-CoA synthase